MKKSIITLIIILFLVTLFNLINSVASNKPMTQTATQINDTQRMKKIWEQENLIKEARSLFEAGEIDQAIEKCRLAANPNLLLHPYDEDPPQLIMARILAFKSEYNKALEIIENVLKKYPTRQGYDDTWDGEKLELKALINARNSDSKQPIYDYISFLKKLNKKNLPPEPLNPYSIAIASTIFRLYDHVGDYEAGMNFADEFIKYYAKKSGIEPEKVGPKNPYLIIKKAFEQDKAEGVKGCVDAKPGEVCMGRVTKAIIQSDYFPW